MSAKSEGFHVAGTPTYITRFDRGRYADKARAASENLRRLNCSRGAEVAP
jgi:hypothetical protein